MSIDQEKAFNKVDRNLLYKTMEKIRYFKQFIQFIDILYQDTQVLITSDGYFFARFNINRGMRQGCSLSLFSVYIRRTNVNI